MADDTTRSIPSPRQEGQGRSPRQGDNREPGGFRIRLSENEMQAARALQEAFGLRSTVAVLGFSLRTLAQQLEAGQLDELVAQQRSQPRDRGPAPVGRGGERRGPRDEARGGGGGGNRVARANPVARPSRPQASPSPVEESSADDASNAEPEDVAVSEEALPMDSAESATATQASVDVGSSAGAETTASEAGELLETGA